MLVLIHKFLNKLYSTPARKNKTIVVCFLIGLTLNLIIWLLIYFKFYPVVYNLPEEQSFVPLHYNIYLGVDLFGKWQKIFILPAIGLIIIIANTILAFNLFDKKELASHFLMISSALSQLILLLAAIFAILINI